MKYRLKTIKMLIAAAVLGAAALMTGCVPQERTSVAITPDLEGRAGADIDFVQVHNDVMEAFGDASPYVFITDCVVDGTNEPKTVTITATCLDEAVEEDAEHFAAAAIRRTSAAMAVQAVEYEPGDQTDFGNVWDSFEFKLTVKRDSAPEGEYLLELDIPAGEEIPLDPDYESYEESWEEQRDMILQNTVY